MRLARLLKAAFVIAISSALVASLIWGLWPDMVTSRDDGGPAGGDRFFLAMFLFLGPLMLSGLVWPEDSSWIIKISSTIVFGLVIAGLLIVTSMMTGQSLQAQDWAIIYGISFLVNLIAFFSLHFAPQQQIRFIPLILLGGLVLISMLGSLAYISTWLKFGFTATNLKQFNYSFFCVLRSFIVLTCALIFSLDQVDRLKDEMRKKTEQPEAQ